MLGKTVVLACVASVLALGCSKKTGLDNPENDKAVVKAANEAMSACKWDSERDWLWGTCE